MDTGIDLCRPVFIANALSSTKLAILFFFNSLNVDTKYNEPQQHTQVQRTNPEHKKYNTGHPYCKGKNYQQCSRAPK